MNISEIKQMCQQKLIKADFENPELQTDLILVHVTGLKRTELYLHREQILPDKDVKNVWQCLERRVRHEPLQYIFGETDFLDCRLLLNPDVLIPRSETEFMVDMIIRSRQKFTKVLDLGTGSGAIAIALAKHFPDAEMDASDISAAALTLARKNAILNNVHINFILSDLFQNINSRYDLIISNPPYVADYLYNDLPDEIRHYEPVKALKAGVTGYEFFRNILAEAKDHLTSRAVIYFEIGYGQADQVRKIATDSGFSSIEVIKDLNGRDRIMIIG
ncbi:MAG: peptide chain release factor N(5)-glutamine methyltransferase [Candidatus Cloacimonetes bacterium]|nr:peptide chain release factor N(5)-glutamine methyltransferase [Candidatus Cloacimonadota bacterium]